MSVFQAMHMVLSRPTELLQGYPPGVSVKMELNLDWKYLKFTRVRIS